MDISGKNEGLICVQNLVYFGGDWWQERLIKVLLWKL